MVQTKTKDKKTDITIEKKTSDTSDSSHNPSPAVKKSHQPQTMEELLSFTGYSLRGLKKGDEVEGTITKVTPREILVDIGGKAEGVVIDRELDSYKDMLMTLKPGDTVTAQVIVEENDRGQAVLSLRRSMLGKRWNTLKEYTKTNTTVTVTVKESVRGGVLVDYGGLRGYIPQSQIEQGLLRTLDRGSHQTFEVKVIEVDPETNRLIFSQRAVSEEEAFAKQKEVIDAISVGDVVEAEITGVVPFGAFAKLHVQKDGKTYDIEGLIHISEIAWEKVEDPGQHISVGDRIKVKIVGIDEATGKVTLSIKQLMPDPWEHVLDMFEKDSQVKGSVSRVTPYGVFVSLSPGIEGLIHISKIIPGEEPKQGEDVTCIVEDVQPEKRKISLAPALTEKPIGYR